jgi:hypothetical protein
MLKSHVVGGGGVEDVQSVFVLSPSFLLGEPANAVITIPMVMHNISKQIILVFITFFLDY